MSRIRSVHPGLWTDEIFVSLSPLARLLFMGIWNEADDKGIFPWSPLQMKMRVLPADNTDAGELMAELEAADCIRRYEIGGKSFGAVRNFAKFQRPKKPNDIHPANPEILEFAGHKGEPSGDNPPPVRKELPTSGEKSPQMEEGGEEIKEKDNPPTPRKRVGNGKFSIPADWKLPPIADLPPKARALAEQWPADAYETHGEAFHGFWTADGRKYKDWALVWANRVVAINGQVMRVPYGSKPAPVRNDPMSPQQWAQFCQTRLDFARKVGRDVQEWEHKLAEAKDRLGKGRSEGGAQPIGALLKVVGETR